MSDPGIRTEAYDDVLVVSGVGRLTAEDVALFRDLIAATLAEHHRVVEVDLSSTSTMDSEGVGALVSIHKRMRERNGSVRLLRPTPFVSELLQLLRLDRVLEIVA